MHSNVETPHALRKPRAAFGRREACDESRVHLGCTYLRFGKKWLRYATPPSLKAEIISFDRGGGFYPGDFRLHPMPEAAPRALRHCGFLSLVRGTPRLPPGIMPLSRLIKSRPGYAASKSADGDDHSNSPTSEQMHGDAGPKDKKP
jgi:hypothetical protein